MPEVDLDPLEEIFRASLFKMLKDEEKKCHPERSERVSDELINKLMSWRHSGFSVHNGVRVARDDEKGREALSQYIIRNTFSLEKMSYIEETDTVIYHSRMSRGKNKKNRHMHLTPLKEFWPQDLVFKCF